MKRIAIGTPVAGPFCKGNPNFDYPHTGAKELILYRYEYALTKSAEVYRNERGVDQAIKRKILIALYRKSALKHLT